MNRSILILPAALALSGCVASTLVDVATMPVRAASQVADWATTSQEESDRNRGQRLREHEARLGKLAKERNKAQAKCENGSEKACAEVESINVAIEEERTRPI